jgi:hypothetical protein
VTVAYSGDSLSLFCRPSKTPALLGLY